MNKLITCLLLCLILNGCNNETPLISNQDRLNDIEKMLRVQKELTSNARVNIWSVLDNPSSGTEQQALKFLYAYMPLSDLADYPPDFMLANVRQSLLARKEMAWGSTIPEEEFLHFVLPLRVNNENLDSFRLAYYVEIKARIKGLTMKDAALEINHWCHEKVNYRGTDSRTSAPMSTIKKSFGRCGEESTFTVAAMRTAGIPSRQVYTPRWAHTDDNHAWVEVWIDGKWHFMGACEPDAELDRGWFSEPSQRTMLVHTRTYGRYFGSEEVLDAEDRFSELNLTSGYAATKKVTVLVNNSNGAAVGGAKVAFKLYNYAEFYPLATLETDSNGIARFTTGLGDLLVWASKEGQFAYKKVNVPTTDTLRLTLDGSHASTLTENLDMVPPKISKAILPVSDEDKRINDKRLAAEDSIRNSYMTTFKDSGWVSSYADKQMLPADTLMRILRLSYGNWKEMISYIENNKATARHLLFPLTLVISDKDLSDTRAAILGDHLSGSFAAQMPSDLPREIFEKYILSPRVDLEILSPWRNFLGKNLGNEMAASTKKDITVLTKWIRNNIRIDPVANKHSRAPLTPIGVYNLRAADPLSRDIFFVAACRTFGIPARLNPEIH
ncbi:MAG TPA: transglutaminase domain-containing protein, partial [Prolixibacteraceae bacterium]|nr:transglutaminase domain-containing protein [Prolixibacteraceae bacterium]